ncbi:hypothetical protein ART_0786 [Arthrobacter sp. PAMC 25486]|uniref:hypothetical protein n=1 Tax=Arthrobacter sp. PAMC 25486 TaxID=1494608 RepID=UPI000535C0B0|nr:hypothetical protein ART_0786 [Arthrobacter sp. PAMC 25486]
MRQPKFRWISVGATVALLSLAEVGAELERARQLQAGIKAEVQLQLPPRDTLTSVKKRGKQLALVAQGRELRPDLASEGDRPASGSTEARAPWWLAVAGAAAIAMTALRNRRRTR